MNVPPFTMHPIPLFLSRRMNGTPIILVKMLLFQPQPPEQQNIGPLFGALTMHMETENLACSCMAWSPEPNEKGLNQPVLFSNLALAAINVFSINMDIVIGPTPPGTGVIADALWQAVS